GGQRPEKRRRLEALAPHDQHDRPADEGNQEQELRDRDRELQRARDHDQRDRADLFETFGGDRMRHVERERVVHGPTSYPVRLKPDTTFISVLRSSRYVVSGFSRTSARASRLRRHEPRRSRSGSGSRRVRRRAARTAGTAARPRRPIRWRRPDRATAPIAPAVWG